MTTLNFKGEDKEAIMEKINGAKIKRTYLLSSFFA